MIKILENNIVIVTMNITIVTNSFGYGGAEKMVFFLAEGLKDRGYNVSMINLNVNGIVARTPSSEILYQSAVIKKASNSFKYHYDYLKFTYKAAKSFRPDIIIAFTDFANFCVPIVAKLLHVPSLISERGDPSALYLKCSRLFKLKFKIMNTADYAVFQTEGAKQMYCTHLKRNSVVIPNPIFLDKSDIPEKKYKDSPKTVVSLCRLDMNSQKRFDVMVRAFYEFHKSHQHYKLVVYGQGECSSLIENLSTELGIRESVELRGRTSTPLESLVKEGIYLISSDYEGISNSLLEAMAVGMPVVSTDHTPGGARLLITDHENGLLAPIGDFNAIAKALGEYADDPQLSEKCGRNAKNVLYRFTPENTLNAWESFIKSIMSRR